MVQYQWNPLSLPLCGAYPIVGAPAMWPRRGGSSAM